MNLFFLHPAAKHQPTRQNEHPVVPRVRGIESPHNTSEGSEFLDDAIRTEDLPLVYTEESIAAGSPQQLL